MIDLEILTRIRQLYYGEHWRVGTIAAELGPHHGTVERVLGDETRAKPAPRPSRFDPYVGLARELLEKHPRLRATRLWQMLRERGCTLSVRQVRDKVRPLRPARARRSWSGASFPRKKRNGADLWVTVLTYIGYFIGMNRELIMRYSHHALTGAVVLSAVIIILYVRSHRKKTAERIKQ